LHINIQVHAEFDGWRATLARLCHVVLPHFWCNWLALVLWALILVSLAGQLFVKGISRPQSKAELAGIFCLLGPSLIFRLAI
jgi:hypothetical protein